MNIEAFMTTLPMMGYGMLGIFTVMLVVAGLIKLLNAWGNSGEK